MIVINGPLGIKHNFFAKAIDPDASYMDCVNNFSLPRSDLDLIRNAEYKQPFESIADVDIIGGTFSRVFLEHLMQDREVFILNVMRNPSASYLTGAEYTIDGDELPMGLEYVTPNVTSAALDNITLSRLDYVESVRFEDVLQDGKFSFMGRDVMCPSVHTNYNNVLTRYEVVMAKRGSITSEMVDQFNNLFSNFNISFINCHNDPRLPSNIFNEMGYTPMSLQEMLDASV